MNFFRYEPRTFLKSFVFVVTGVTTTKYTAVRNFQLESGLIQKFLEFVCLNRFDLI